MDDGQFERLVAEFAESRRQTKEGFAAAQRYTDVAAEGLREEIRRSAEELRREFRESAEETRQELRREFRESAEETRQELRREFGVIEESWRSMMQQLAEGFAMLDGKIERQGAEMKTDSAETRSLIKLAYNDLDRRVTRLERELHP